MKSFSTNKRIAVVGSGISGLLCARLLATRHEVVLFEAAETLGGHTNTVDVEAFGDTWTVDTGFMVFNDRTYPNFIRMLELLGVDSQASDMSFSVRCDHTSWEYQGSSLNGLFAQRSNLVRPRFYRMLRDILRFNRLAPQFLQTKNTSLLLHQFLQENGLGEDFANQYLLPMTAAIWSAPTAGMKNFPARFLIQFLHNHGLLQLRDRPQWRTIPGGARRYVQALAKPLGDAIHTSSPVTSAIRHDAGVTLTIKNMEKEDFDHVVFACHAPQTLRILQDMSRQEKEVLEAFPYQQNTAYLHTDQSQLPQRQRAWASWNYRSSGNSEKPVSVTYDLSRLQQVRSPQPLLLTLNPCCQIRQEKILREIAFEHPLFNARTPQAQDQHDQLHKDGRVLYCGAYWGYGFHEDGVRSALRVCKRFGINLDDVTSPCKVASMKVG